MILVFKRFSEYISFDIDRKNKTYYCIGEQTNYQKEELPWRMLWDKCEHHKLKQNEDNTDCKDCDAVAEKQDKETEGLKDQAFVEVFESQMKIYGFTLEKWE